MTAKPNYNFDQSPADPNVLGLYEDLIRQGANDVYRTFSVAGPQQADVMFNERRYLLTPNDEQYADYIATMTEADQPYIHNNPDIGNSEVVAGEIMRGARNLLQIIPSVQPKSGAMTTGDIFHRFGNGIRVIANKTGKVPAPESIDLKRVLMLRSQETDEVRVTLVPPVEFEPASQEVMTQIISRMRSLLFPDYARFSASALLQKFSEGLEDDVT